MTNKVKKLETKCKFLLQTSILTCIDSKETNYYYYFQQNFIGFCKEKRIYNAKSLFPKYGYTVKIFDNVIHHIFSFNRKLCKNINEKSRKKLQ